MKGVRAPHTLRQHAGVVNKQFASAADENGIQMGECRVAKTSAV